MYSSQMLTSVLWATDNARIDATTTMAPTRAAARETFSVWHPMVEIAQVNNYETSLFIVASWHHKMSCNLVTIVTKGPNDNIPLSITLR